MYFWDPNRGRYRRSLVRDQFIALGHDMARFCDAACCDLQNRFEGTKAEVHHLFSGESVSDQVLEQRVRAQMGRCLSHPHNIVVSADHGRITLRGPILSQEADSLVQCVRMVRGVTGIRNELEQHDEAGDLPALQGGRAACSPTGNWSPSTRLLAGTLGTGLLLRGFMQSFPASFVSGAIGLALMNQAYTTSGRGSIRGRRRGRILAGSAGTPSRSAVTS